MSGLGTAAPPMTKLEAFHQIQPVCMKKINERVKPWFFRFSQLSFLQAVISRAVAVSEQAVIVGDSVRNFLGRVEIS